MIKIEKVTVNIGVGAAGDTLDKAEKLLEKLCEQKPVRTLAKSRIPTWGVRKKMQIGVKVTMRDERAMKFLTKALGAKENKLKSTQFDDSGNFAFGISEYIDMPGVKYDPELGIFGFDVCVTLEKDGYRVKKRKRAKAKLPNSHKLTKEESIDWVQKNLNVVVM